MAKWVAYGKLAKALLAGRVDIIAGLAWATPHAFERLGRGDDIIELGRGPDIRAHIYMRASLPQATKKAIHRLLDQRIQELTKNKQLESILWSYR